MGAVVLQGWPALGGALLFATASGVTRIARDPLPRPVGTVVESLFRYAPERFVRSLAAATGQSVEGVVSFGFHGEHPGEIPPGHVSADYLDEEAHVTDTAFLTLGLSIAAAHAAAADEGLFAPLRSALERLLRDGRGDFRFLLRFEPTFRVLVYDRYGEGSGGAIEAVAEVLSDGKCGRVTVHDPARADLIRTLFAEPIVRVSGRPVEQAAEGLRGDPEPIVLQPFAEATLHHVVATELSLHGLHGTLSVVG